jgi:hypothetical protein
MYESNIKFQKILLFSSNYSITSKDICMHMYLRFWNKESRVESIFMHAIRMHLPGIRMCLPVPLANIHYTPE